VRTIGRFLRLTFVAAAAACSDPTGVERAGVRAEPREESLLVTNRRSAAIYVFAVDQGRAALINWGPCEDPERCESVAASQERSLPMPEGEAANVVLYWWHLLPQPGGGFAYDSIRSLVVPR
jgi:hypothetical protein